MTVLFGPGIDIGPGITAGGAGAPAPSLLLSLDATDYSGSGTTWTAATGSNSTLVNAPTYTAASPTYFSFAPASSQYATVPSLSSLSSWTLECWFMATSSLASQVTTVAGDRINTSNINFTLAINPLAEGTGVLKAGFYNGGWRLTSGFVPTLNTWYQSVATYDGSTINQYSNGSLQSTTNYSGSSTTDGLGIRIAARWDTIAGSINYFPGRIAIVKIYNGDIGSGGVTSSWNSNKARFGL